MVSCILCDALTAQWSARIVRFAAAELRQIRNAHVRLEYQKRLCKRLRPSIDSVCIIHENSRFGFEHMCEIIKVSSSKHDVTFLRAVYKHLTFLATEWHQKETWLNVWNLIMKCPL